MKRIERIQSMTAPEMADAMRDGEATIFLKYCNSSRGCGPWENIPPEQCRQCLIEWLMEEIE